MKPVLPMSLSSMPAALMVAITAAMSLLLEASAACAVWPLLITPMVTTAMSGDATAMPSPVAVRVAGFGSSAGWEGERQEGDEEGE